MVLDEFSAANLQIIDDVFEVDSEDAFFAYLSRPMIRSTDTERSTGMMIGKVFMQVPYSASPDTGNET